MSSLSRILLFFILCCFTPLVLWLAIAEFAGQYTYLALSRSGFLLIGLVIIGWAGLRDRPQMVWVGLALIGIGFLTFYCGRNLVLPTLDLTESSWLWEIRQCLAVPIPPMSRLTFGHVLVAGTAFINAAILLNDSDLRQIIAANLLFITAVGLACVLSTF
jgi:hypothetical protein